MPLSDFLAVLPFIKNMALSDFGGLADKEPLAASPLPPSGEPYDLEIAREEKLRQFERDLLGEPKFKAQYDTWSLSAPPSLSENDTFAKRLQPPGTRNTGVLLNIKPNPYITGMRKIDPNYFTNDFLHGKYNRSIDL